MQNHYNPGPSIYLPFSKTYCQNLTIRDNNKQNEVDSNLVNYAQVAHVVMD